MSRHAKSSQSPSTLHHAMLMLQVTAARGYRGADINDYMDALELSRPTIYRLLKGLSDQGFLRNAPVRGRYLLGYELLVLGSQAGNGSGLRDLTRPRLLDLAQRFGDSFYLFALDGFSAVCLEVQNGKYPVGSFVRSTGGRIPLGAGQASTALLAALGKSERDAILANNAAHLEHEYGISVHAINAEISHSLKVGYARGAEGSHLPEYTGLAIPVLDHSGHPLGAISCSMLKSRLNEEHKQQVLEGMRNEVAELVQQAHGLLYIE